MIEEKITPKVADALKVSGIEADEILASSPLDLSFEAEYLDGYLVLTKTKLALALYDKRVEEVRVFKGYAPKKKKKKIEQTPVESDVKVAVWDREKISDLRMEHQVATNLLVATIGGESVQICAFTNLYMGTMNHLLKVYENPEQALKKKEDQEEDPDLFCPICHTKYPDPKRKICPNCMSKKSIFVRALKYFTKYKLALIIMFAGFGLSAAIGLIWPYFTGSILYGQVLEKKEVPIFDFLGLSGKHTMVLIALVITLLGSRLLNMLNSMVHGIVSSFIVVRSVLTMKKDVFASMEKLSMRFYTSKQTGTLMTRCLRDAERISGFFLDGAPGLIVNSISIIITFVVIYRMNWQMSIVASILLPLLVILSVKLKPGLWILNGRRHRAESSVNSRVNDNLTGARVVRAFGQEEPETSRFESPNEYLRDAEVRIVKYNNRFTLLYELIQQVSSIWVWVLGSFMVLNVKSMSYGDLITFVGYVGQMNGPLQSFSWMFRSWSDSINAAQRMFEIIDAVPEVREDANPIPLTNPRGEIVIRDMSFGYDANRPILKKINLHVQPGEMLGIVGRSGAGKTTLVSLLSRLYDVDDGSIEIDGINVKKLSFKDLRRNIAMVSQETYIFMGSVLDNIAYAREGVSRLEVIDAAKLAGAHDFISKMPDGYDTIIGSAGRQLSGGERQRISIARAIVANPQILILDEATASVDTETEKIIQNSLNRLIQGRTTLSIAHRLSTLRDAKHLIVIENGRIEEEGSREELDALGGIYHKLSTLQTQSLALKELEQE